MIKQTIIWRNAKFVSLQKYFEPFLIFKILITNI